MRAALYARYSTDNQSDASVEDQLRLCRGLAERMGAHAVREFSDAAISGSSLANRPGARALLAAARAGELDLVIAEHTDRLSRDGGDTWAIFKDLRALGVRYVTVNQGEITSMHVGLSGTMSELMIEEIARKTKRGLQGVVEGGRSGGGLTYGYRVKRAYDERGEPVRGLLEIDEPQAEVVRRIFRDYAAGASPLAIAAALNAEGVPGPRGGVWNHTTIAGSAARGTGVIHNELYIGVRVWGRRTFVKDRATGARRGRMSAADPIRVDAPDLRIITPDLWDRARARHAEASASMARDPDGRRLGNGKRPKRFLSGLIRCSLCGGPMTRAGPKEALRCATRAYRKGCENTSAPGYPGIEARVVSALKANLLHPAVIDHVIRQIQEGMAAGQKDAGKARQRLMAELADVKRRADRLLDQVADGVLSGQAVADKLAQLNQRREDIEGHIADLGRGNAEVQIIGPAAAALYRQHVEALADSLDLGDTPDARDDRAAVRALIHEVRFTPLPGFNKYDLEIVGDLAPLLQSAPNAKSPLAGAQSALQVMREVGAGTGFEPVTFRL